MADTSRGMASWLHKPEAPVVSAAAADKLVTQAAEMTSPLDISLAILRAKETINRISPDKRALVEEIDEEEDDAEFDEKAHWGRRRRATATAKRSSKKGGRNVKPNYSIKAFCTTQRGSEEGVGESAGREQPEAEIEGATTVEHAVQDEAESPESAPVEMAIKGMVTTSTETTTVAADTDGNKEKQEPADNSSGDNTVNSVEAVASPDSSNTDTTTPISSGRLKRQAVLNTLARKQMPPSQGVADIVDLLTPPERNSLTKKIPKAKRSGAAAAADRGFPDLKTPPAGGRKRKLEMDRTTPSPGAKIASKESFFLSEQDKKQLQEIEAVATLREQMRKTREKDLAFFSGKTAVNPFFQVQKARENAKSSSSETDVIEVEDSESGRSAPGSVKSLDGKKRKPRWSKDVVHFPHIQHVYSTEIDALSKVDALPPLQIPRKPESASKDDVVLVVDDDDEMEAAAARSALYATSSAYRQQQVQTETTFSDLFWFRQYHDDSSSSVTTKGPADYCEPDLFPMEYDSENLLIDALVDRYGTKEKRVREMLTDLLAAKAKRCEKEHNLTFVDRYVPVTASGIVGNKEPMRLLSSWLNAWKVGGDERARRSCFQAELFVFEDDESDEDELSDLCRLFILEGESGAGKSAAVYACAEELGFQIIEINAGQNRTGRTIVEIAGEATQSTRVLHSGMPSAEKKKQKKQKLSKKQKRKSADKPTASHLSLVLFEDVDVVFEEDKGFLTSLCAIAKHSKCPIVLTCRKLPDNFPATPQRLCQVLTKPSMNEFSTWMMLVAYIEQLPLTHALTNAMATFFKCDIRHALHFLQTQAPHFANKQSAAKWTWQPEHYSITKAPVATIELHDDEEVVDVDYQVPLATMIPAWTQWSSRSFDMLSSNLLSELSASDAQKTPEEDKTKEEKVKDTLLIQDLAAVLDAISVADVWCNHGDQSDHEDLFFEREQNELKSLDLRMSSLSALLTPGGIGRSVLLEQKGTGPTCSSDCIQRTLDATVAQKRRNEHQAELNTMKFKVELPLAAIGPGNSSFHLDYMPMISRILSSNVSNQESRRRVSRRNHYLREVISDMSLLDDIPKFTTYVQQLASDQIVAASPSSSPLS
uniref:ATPase AAA-type core domain-containing protein n=1 Tax=Globisporangium ultimum (strain ATCC 200006 / CBS 805.95 / DAOM BR144) TaxID=431595 RepID=K3WSX3_GLOUD